MITGAGLDHRAHSGHGCCGHEVLGPVLLTGPGSTVRILVTRLLGGLVRGFDSCGAGVESGARRGHDVAVTGPLGGLLTQEHEGSTQDVMPL